MRKLLLCFVVWLMSGLTLLAGELSFRGTTDKETALYRSGEKMTFSIQLLEDAKPVAGRKLKWVRSGDDAKTENGTAISSATKPLIVTTSLEKPGFVRIEVWVVDEKGNPIANGKHAEIKFTGGAGVEAGKLEGLPEPPDFDAFWARQKARLAQVPLKCALVKVPSKNPDFLTYDVRIDCAGGKPVSGYFTKPKNAAPKSLKAQGGYMGYGVNAPSPSYANGTLTLNINAHGIENGREDEYYKKLKEGELKGYAFNNEENAKPETSYFNGMILRVLRALEFLKAQPEWNGKDLIVAGGSQGGFQALSAAALDKDVTQCQANIPWLCDLGGIQLGRLRGWRPDYTIGLAYYDAANQAKRIRCKTTIVAGLGDYTCPPSGICVLYNNLKGPKQLEFLQGKTHMYTPPKPQKFILKSEYSF